MLGIALEHDHVARTAADVDAGHVRGRPAELARRLVEIVRRHRLGHLNEVLLAHGNAEHLAEGFLPHFAHLADVSNLHRERIEPHEARLREVAVFEQHLRAHQLGELRHIGFHALRRGHLGAPFQVRHDAVAKADALLLVDEGNVGVGQCENGIDVLGIEPFGLADDGALRESVVVADGLGQEFLFQNDVVENLSAVVERGQKSLRGCRVEHERLGHVAALHTLEVGVRGAEIDGKREGVVSGDVGRPARTDHSLGGAIASVVGERHGDVVEVAGELVVLRAHALLRFQAALAHDDVVARNLPLVAVLEERKREAVVLQLSQGAIHELHGVLVRLRRAHKRKNAQREGHGDEIASVVGLVVAQVGGLSGHVVTLKRDVFALFLHGNAQNGPHGFGGTVLRVDELEFRLSGDGSPEVGHVKILEKQRFQWQHEVAVVGVARAHAQVSVEEAVAVERVVELDERRLEEIVVGEPRIFVRSGGQHALLGRQPIVFGTNHRGIGPGRRDVFERVGLRRVQVVLQHERQRPCAVVA